MPLVRTVSNVISSVIFGHRFSEDDENLHHLIDSIDVVGAFGNSIIFFVRKFICLFVHFVQIDKEKGSLYGAFRIKVIITTPGIAAVLFRTILPGSQFRTCSNFFCFIIAQKFPISVGQGWKQKDLLAV